MIIISTFEFSFIILLTLVIVFCFLIYKTVRNIKTGTRSKIVAKLFLELSEEDKKEFIGFLKLIKRV